LEDILDALRRIVSRWVETLTPITEDVAPGQTLITVASSRRFRRGDEVMIEAPLDGEPNLVVEEIVDDTHIRLATPVFNTWSVSESPSLRKLINGRFVQGIYIGDPDVIPVLPAIVINGTTLDSEWMTLDSTKETFNIELSVYIEESSQEEGYRFLLRIVNVIREGLKRNIFPLVNDFDSTSVTADILPGDRFIKVADSSIFNTVLTDTSSPFPRIADARLILENRFISEETRVQNIIDETTIEIAPAACQEFLAANNVIAINPKRFIYNSWPRNINFGKISKGSLMQAAVINWFAEEEVVQNLKGNDPHLK